jgi:hypothetical protein
VQSQAAVNLLELQRGQSLLLEVVRARRPVGRGASHLHRG